MRTREVIAALSIEEKMEFLKSCTTAFAVDAMNLLQLKRWGLEHLAPLKPGQMMAAPASTFRLERLRKGEPTKNAYDALEVCEAGTVMCIANIHDTFLIGGNVVTFAQNKGIAGLVIEASNRDTREMKKLDIPVYSQGIGAKVLNSDIPVSFEQTDSVEIGGGKIYAGDILFGDDDGVIVIPKENLDEVIYQLEMIKAVEDEAAEALKNKTYSSPREFFDKVITKKKHCRE